jgi:predicted DNA-binding WGR domain protein
MKSNMQVLTINGGSSSAKSEAERLVVEKLKKGYVEKPA